MLKKTFNFTIIFLLFLASGCWKNDEATNIHLRLTENPITLDPTQVVDVTGGEICAKIFSGLLKFDDQFNIVPELAKSFEILNNGLIIKFTLKDNLKFSNGYNLSSEDVLFSFERLLSKDFLSPRKWILEKIKKITVIDQLNFEIELSTPFVQFLSLLTMPAASIISKKSFLEDKKIIGSGPYFLEKWINDVKIILKPNINYVFNKNLKNTIVYKIIPEDSTAVTMICLNELDILKIPRQQTEFLKNKLTNFNFQSIEELNTYFIGFDHRKPYIDSYFKTSVASIINRKSLIKSILNNQANAAFSPIPSILFNYNNNKLPEYNPALAQNLIKKSQAFEKKIIFLVPSVKETILTASIIQDELKKINLDVELKIMDWSAFKEAISKGEADMFLMSWWADYADPENFLYPTFHSKNIGSLGNRVYYINPKLDQLLDNLHTELNLNNRINLQKQMIDIINSELPWIPLWHKTSIYAVSPKISNYSAEPLYSMEKLAEINKTT